VNTIAVRSIDALSSPPRHALFDFDGTISVIRQGWERVMVPMMIEMIAGEHGDHDGAVRQEVEAYVDESTGIQTILQMEWLSQAVARHRGAQAALSAKEYKALYNARLLAPVRERLDGLERGELTRDALMIVGAERFVRALAERGLTLYVASGTDREHVRRECAALGMDGYFTGGIFGALDTFEEYSKAKVIRDILDTHGLEGPELLVVGDGPVEIREGKARGALTIGVASDEVARHGLNPHKHERLANAGADILIPDFLCADELLARLFDHPA